MDETVFANLVEYKAGLWRLFAMTIWRFWISDFKYVLLLVQVFAIDCSNAGFARNASCVCVRGEQGHITVECTARQKSS